MMEEINWKLEDFSMEEMKDRQSVSSSNDVVQSENVKPRKDDLIHQNQKLKCKVKNLSTKKKKTSFARFKVKKRIIYGLLLIDTGNLVHSTIVSWDFWEFIGGKINSPMDHQVGTANGQSEGLQVVGVGAPWPVYLERTESVTFQNL